MRASPPLLSAKRLSSVDLLKGIGIFLVVMGHCPDELNLHRWIYAFHMPLFAFIGGLFLRPQPFRQFAVKKMTRLLVPFFAWSLFFWVLYDLVIYFCEPRLLGAQLKQIVYIAIGSGQNAVKGYANVALWFLPFLFSASMIYFIVAKLSERKWVEYAGVVFIAALGLICGFWELRLPYKLNTAFTLYPFLWAGTKYFRIIQSVQLHTWGRWAAMIICLCIYVPCTLFNTRVDTASNVVGNFALFYPAAFAAIIFCAIICRMIDKIGFVNFIGRNSLVILIFHMPIIQLILYLAGTYMTFAMLLLLPVAVVILCVPVIYFINRFVPELIGLERIQNKTSSSAPECG